MGVKDNGNIAGVKSEEEMYMIEQAATMYCRPAQMLQFDIYKVEGKTVLLAQVAEADAKPVQAPDESGKWRAYFRVADENVLASGLHVKVMKHIAADEGAMVSFSAKEKELLAYLDGHGGITLSGFSKLAHISRFAAEEALINLLEMKVVKLSYHNGECLISKA